MSPLQQEVAASGQVLAKYIAGLPDFKYHLRFCEPVYWHMGAVLADAILQAGVNYRHVVYPRVQRILELYPQAVTSSFFRATLLEEGAAEVLLWRHPEKPRRLAALCDLLIGKGVDTVAECRTWLANDMARNELRSLRGVGEKTIDYLCMLVGIPAIAVDRHLARFVANAGVAAPTYAYVRTVVAEAAELLGVGHSTLDYSIWSYASTLSQ